MNTFSREEIKSFLDKLKNKEILPTHIIEKKHKYSLLQAVMDSDLTVVGLVKYSEEFISYGCDPDYTFYGFTPLEIAAMGNSSWDFIPLVSLFLKNHKYGDLSDFSILKIAVKSFDNNMFKFIVDSGKVDVNAFIRGRNILHYLASEHGTSNFIDLFLKKYPNTKLLNSIDKGGLSPLAIAFNTRNVYAINSFISNNFNSVIANNANHFAKAIGKLTNPNTLVDRELVNLYDGNFWNDYPDMIGYAIKNDKHHLIPNGDILSDIFLY